MSSADSFWELWESVPRPLLLLLVVSWKLSSFFVLWKHHPKLCLPLHTAFSLGMLLSSCSVMSDSLHPHGLQHTRLPCSLPSPGACSNSCPSSRWCHLTISSSVVPFSSCPQSFPTSGSFPMSWLFTSGGQSIGTSASAAVLPMSSQGWFPLELTGLISLLYVCVQISPFYTDASHQIKSSPYCSMTTSYYLQRVWYSSRSLTFPNQ